MPEYQLDFDQVAEYGFRSKHVATFPCRLLELATDPKLRQCQLVRTYERFHHDQWYLPLREAHVRSWLKLVRFTKPPVVTVNGVEMSAGKEVVV